MKHLMLGLLLLLSACVATRTQQAPGEAIDDSTVTARVKAALIADPTTKAWQIEVETFRGRVQLSGFVDTSAAKARAGEIARTSKGVRSVRNNLEVRAGERSAGGTLDDTVISTKVKTALIGNPITKARQINVETSGGVVQLSGFVDDGAEKTEAERVASQVEGVTAVHNELVVKSR